MKTFKQYIAEKSGAGEEGTDELVKTLKKDTPHSYDENKGPCWSGYRQVGMKKKNGKEVPNCVPESVEEINRHGIPKDATKSELKKIRSSDKSSKGAKNLAHWLLNMHHNDKKS